MKKRKVIPGEVHHIYQRTIGGGVLFYSVKDYLVFFTLYCRYARAMGLRVLALCPMPDHLHQVVVASSRRQLSQFQQTVIRLFAFEWNRRRGRKGPLFHHPFGSAVKQGAKKVRTTLAYCYNNPVERKLARRPGEWRWTFLAYRENPAPFSAPLRLAQAGPALRKALREVQLVFACGGHLHYPQLEKWERRLSAGEWQQLIDYIIVRWNVIDYQGAISYYGDWETMLRSFGDNTGSEYEIQEDRDPYSDIVYADCARVLLSDGLVKDLSEIPRLSDGRKNACRALLERRTTAHPVQIRKFLHIKRPQTTPSAA